jgi:D-alanyl-lipoteichoic acid acyltransferase DltB (MBOAT superfamily)
MSGFWNIDLELDRILSDLPLFFRYSLNPNEHWVFTQTSFLLVLSFFLVGYAFFKSTSRWKLAYLIGFSLFFYYKSSGPFLALFILVILCDFLFAKWIDRHEGIKRKVLMLVSVSFSLSFLLYFKYTDFIIENLNAVFLTSFSKQNLFLPIGISFYTFQSLSYILDVYRKELAPSKDLLSYGFYMSFFPHLVAGPIVRAKDFLPQITNPIPFTTILLRESIFRITVGLIKKLIIADYFGKYVNELEKMPEGHSGFEHFVGMYSQAFQIYFDFSAYSDIAIGIALVLGYRLKENFNNPYFASNITSFWRRWHISLSLWLRDYIYIPLGGNRKGKFLMYVFLLTTMLIGGFWHGPYWTMILWGLGHGILLALHKMLSSKDAKTSLWSRGLGTLVTFHCVTFLWIFFNANDLYVALLSFRKIFLEMNFNEFTFFWRARPEIILLSILAFFIVFIPMEIKQKVINPILCLPLYLWPIILLVVLQAILQLRDSTVVPFLYGGF